MNLYFAGNTGTKIRERILIRKKCSRLFSYHFINTREFQADKMYNMSKRRKTDLFLDSGAYSAFTKGKKINLKKYISFIKRNKKHLTVYANLDVIGINGSHPNEQTAKKTLSNQKKMEASELNPLPCFHYGEPFKYLKYYIDNYEYIALGAMVGVSTTSLIHWLDKVFSRYICDKKGIPIIKVHGFGVTSIPILLRYPFYSIDSTSWVVTTRLGSIYIPLFKNGKWDYLNVPHKVNVSSRSPQSSDIGKHYLTMSYLEQKFVKKYLQEKGIKLGKSSFHQVTKDYKLQENERWFNKEYGGGKRDIEKIVERGVSNDYKLRDKLNVQYFLDLEKNLPKWPWAFNINNNKGFGL